MTEWTKTETLRRLRAAAALCRAADSNIGKTSRVELGTRLVPQYGTGPTDCDPDPEGDDLESFWSLADTVRWMPDQARRPGYFANLYFTTAPGTYSEELYTVSVVWLGDDANEPVLIYV